MCARKCVLGGERTRFAGEWSRSEEGPPLRVHTHEQFVVLIETIRMILTGGILIEDLNPYRMRSHVAAAYP